MRRVLSVLAVVLFASSSSANPTEARLDALATIVAQWQQLPEGATRDALATPSATLVQHMALVVGNDVTPEESLHVLLSQLRTRGVDALAAINVSAVALSRAACKSRQNEARTTLRAIANAQISVNAERDVYAADFDRLRDYYRPVEAKHYRFAISEGSSKGYLVTAAGVDDMAGDDWVVTSSDPTPKVLNDLCARIRAAEAPPPPPPPPTPEAVVAALSTLSRSVDVKAESDKVAVMALATIALHAAGVDGPIDEESGDAAKLKALIASVKKQGGDLADVLAPVLDEQAEKQCRSDRYYAEHAVREIASHYVDGSSATTLYSAPQVAHYAFEERGTREKFTVKAKGTGPMKGDVIVETELGLQKPKSDFCAKKKSTVLGRR